MPIPVACPGCSARLNAPDVAAGKRVKCPKCQTLIPVPAASDEEVDEPTARPSARRPRDEGDDDRPRRRPRDDEDDADDRPRPKRRRKPAASGGVPVWAYVVGGLVVAGAAVAGVVVSLNKKKDDAPAAAGGGGGLLEQVGAAVQPDKTLKPGEKKEVRRALATVDPGPDGWARVDDPTHGFRGELPGRAFPTAMSENNPKVVADRGYRWAVWHVPSASDQNGPEVWVGIYRHQSKPYPTTPEGQQTAAREAMWDAFNPDDTGLTATPATVDGRQGVEVRFRQPTFNERVAKQNPKGGAAEPDDPTDVPDHTVIRVAADGRWLYAVRLKFHQRKPDDAVLKRVFDSLKIKPPDGG